MSDKEFDEVVVANFAEEGGEEAAATNSAEEESSRRFKYATLCEYLDRMQRIHWKDKFGKQRVLKALITKWSTEAAAVTAGTVSFYPVLRIMANSLDGRKFHMKSSAKWSIERLSEEVAQRNPVFSKEGLSLFDVNDSLCKITETELSDTELETLLRACATAREVYWLLQVLIRGIERALSVTSAHLVSWVHPNGVELRQAGVSLRQICQLAAEGKMSDDSSILFRRFEPMLLSRIRYGSANVYDKLTHFCGKQFYVEVKYDGEHFLLHRGPGGEMRYFSRVQNDFTNTIAPVLDHRINPYFAPSVESCILDTELLLWDTIDEKFVGQNAQASDGRIYDVKALRTDGVVVPSVAVFDLLFLNGQSLMDVPLKERVAILQSGSVLQRQDNAVIFVSEFRLVKTREEFASLYEAVVKNGEEGVVAKRMDSVYKTGVRQMANGWFKVAFYHGKFFMVGKVGTGLDDTTRSFLKNRLMREHGFLKGDIVPEWIHEGYTSNDLPTNFVHKDNFQVVEIRAKGLRNGRLYAPSLKAYRDDKYVKDIDQYQDFLDFDNNLRVDSIGNARSTVDPRKRTTNMHVPEVYKAKKVHVEEISQDLKGKQICILRGAVNVTAEELREIVASFGGTHVANPGPKTLFIVTGEPAHMKSRSFIRSNKYNVVSAEWLVACRDAGSVVPLTEKQAIHIVDDSVYALFGGDKNGDGSEMRTISGTYTVANVSAMLDKIKVPKRKRPSSSEETLRKQLLNVEKFDRFSGQIFYIEDSLTKMQKTYIRILLLMHGAGLSIKLDNSISHIVVPDRKKAEKRLSGKATVVDMAWLESALDME